MTSLLYTFCELAKFKEGRLSKCLIHASRKSGKEKREKFLVIGATRCATKFKIDIYQHEIKRILTPNSEQSICMYAPLSIYTQKFLACCPLALV